MLALTKPSFGELSHEEALLIEGGGVILATLVVVAVKTIKACKVVATAAAPLAVSVGKGMAYGTGMHIVHRTNDWMDVAQ